MKNVLVVGGANTDMIIRVPHIPKWAERRILGGAFSMAAGGKGGNQAVAGARAGGRVTFVAASATTSRGGRHGELRARRDRHAVVLAHARGAASGIALITVDQRREQHLRRLGRQRAPVRRGKRRGRRFRRGRHRPPPARIAARNRRSRDPRGEGEGHPGHPQPGPGPSPRRRFASRRLRADTQRARSGDAGGDGNQTAATCARRPPGSGPEVRGRSSSPSESAALAPCRRDPKALAFKVNPWTRRRPATSSTALAVALAE